MLTYSVEGDWKNFYIKMAEPCDYDRIIDHLICNYLIDEPVSKFAGVSKGAVEDYRRYYEVVLPQNLSFFAIDKLSNKIAGARITMNHTRQTDFLKLKFESREMRALFELMTHLEKKANVFDRFGIKSYADFISASVDREFRRQGLLTEMYKRAIPFYKEQGFPMAKSMFTNPISRRAAKNLGFQELARVYYEGFDDENGEPFFPMLDHENVDEEFAAYMVLFL